MLSNFREDKQLSMLRFGALLGSTHLENPRFEIIESFPQPFFSKIIPNKKVKKWAAYLDKYLLFPRRMRHKLQSLFKPVDLFHIIDHSNSIYLPHLKKLSQSKKIVTCHDLIAIRTAHGEFPNATKTSKSGKHLQKWIYNSLKLADYYACDSLQTKKDLARLVPCSKLNSSVLHLGTEIKTLPCHDQRTIPYNLPFNPSKSNYILNVGSAAWYKNRKAVYKAFKNASERFQDLDLKLVLVGPEPQSEELETCLSNWFQSNQNSLICLNNLSENSLSKVYQHAKALVFPSYIEGFGWPPLEAAVHGCPVITTCTGAIFDLLGKYPIYVEADAQASIDQAVIDVIQSSDKKDAFISLPSHDDCRKSYFDLYEQMINN